MPNRAQKAALQVRKDFARRLSVARERAGFRFKKDLSTALGVEAETYNGWERGRTEPSLYHLSQISELTDTSLDFLVMGVPVNRGGPKNE